MDFCGSRRVIRRKLDIWLLSPDWVICMGRDWLRDIRCPRVWLNLACNRTTHRDVLPIFILYNRTAHFMTAIHTVKVWHRREKREGIRDDALFRYFNGGYLYGNEENANLMRKYTLKEHSSCFIGFCYRDVTS